MTYTVNTQYNTQKTHTFHSPPQKKYIKANKQNKTNKKEQKNPHQQKQQL